ncbi:MAG TPA: hypothetical protein VGM84_23125 [Steroidobacteraceae bacterium]|jgi:hypothetical protein
MGALAEKLAESLNRLRATGALAIRTDQLSRTDRQRLLQAGFIHEVMKGWYAPARPGETEADKRQAWYASFWGFCSGYLEDRFGGEWCLSPQSSISLHAGDWTVPQELRVRSPKGGNKPTSLPFGTSVFDVRLEVPPPGDREVIPTPLASGAAARGQRVFALPAALIACSPEAFTARSNVLRTALGRVDDASDLLRRLHSGGRTVVAGRLAGAFRSIGRPDTADQLLRSMREAGHLVQETDPFRRQPLRPADRSTARAGEGLDSLWSEMREPALRAFPLPPPQTQDPSTYLARLDALYATDAYHSLSLEGYTVTQALIEQVRPGHRGGADSHPQNRNALAIRGYRQAFRRVMKSIQSILGGENPVAVVQRDCEGWYANLFGPSIAAGLSNPSALEGTVLPEFFSLLAQEADPRARAVLGHFLFMQVRPRLEGNGLMARFVMNAMLAADGYPWTLIPIEAATEYRKALQSAGTHRDIRPLAEFLARRVKATA